MSPQELCYSTLETIVEGSAIACLSSEVSCIRNILFTLIWAGDIDIQVLSMNGIGSLQPVYDYFVRCGLYSSVMLQVLT
jgi:hypothetical protein